MMRRDHNMAARRGVAVLFAVVVLVLLGTLSGTAVWQMIACRRALDRRANVLQAGWLARSAAAVTAARLAGNEKEPTDAAVKLLPGWTVTVQVQKSANEDSIQRLRTTVSSDSQDANRVSVQWSWTVRLGNDPRRFSMERDDDGSPTDVH